MSHKCEDEHDESPEFGIQYSLYTKIDTENVECLNETVDGSGKDVFKAWENRHDFEKFVESDCDQELLFNIPFTGTVKLKGLIIIGGEEDTHPSRMKLFKNRPKLTFDDAQGCCDQEFELHPDNTGTLEYNTKLVVLSSTDPVDGPQ
ncbi:PITHD1 [Cordylochernes scorpioides]|uniref:PITHD1 n=1 Tax=Cordylochernes scorpioides TaxID=51811 RepID=A0ABY6KIZ1_9ARAC|nr:PITHD1 [Cordylochernes scorpioides]